MCPPLVEILYTFFRSNETGGPEFQPDFCGSGLWVYLAFNAQAGFYMHDPVPGKWHLNKPSDVFVAPIVNQPDCFFISAHNMQ